MASHRLTGVATTGFRRMLTPRMEWNSGGRTRWGGAFCRTCLFALAMRLSSVIEDDC
jgi:hypothetical protein